MRYTLSKFNSIPSDALEKLTSAGINDTDQLLSLAAIPKERKALAGKLKVSMEEITKWSGFADLVRVKGIGPSLAELLVASGMAGNIQAFIEAMHAPALVYAGIKSYVQRIDKASFFPTRQQLISIAEEAAELRPKLLLSTSEIDSSFRNFILSREREERSHSRRLDPALIGIVILAIGILYGLMQVYINHILSARSIPGDILNQYSIEIARIMLNVANSSALLVSGIIIASMTGLIIFYSWISHLQNIWLVIWLFDHPHHRDFFRALKAINLKKQVRAIWWAVGIFTLLAVGLVLYAAKSIMENAPTDVLINYLIAPVVGGGALLVIVTSLPILKFFLKDFKIKNNLESFHRYMIFIFGKFLMIPLMVVLLVKIVFPISFILHNQIYLNWIVPSARQKLLEERYELVNLKLNDPLEESRRESILQSLDDNLVSELPTFGAVNSEFMPEINDVFIPAALNMVVWIALTVILLLFVVPYLILGGWKRGVLYILILGIGFKIENLLSSYSPAWFSLPKNSVSSFLFISFFILGNALFFDWLFDELTVKNKICLSCGTSLPTDAFFCSHCGFVQKR